MRVISVAKHSHAAGCAEFNSAAFFSSVFKYVSSKKQITASLAFAVAASLVVDAGFHQAFSSDGSKSGLKKIATRSDGQRSGSQRSDDQRSSAKNTEPVAKTIAEPVQPNLTSEISAVNALEKFYSALQEIQSGKRSAPVTVLHLGDDHIARDRLSGDLREMLQARFGDAGRGMVMPGPVFPFYRANGVHIKSMGNWTIKSSLSSKDAIFGITGVAYTSSDPQAHVELSSTTQPFSFVELTVLSGPDQGTAKLVIRKANGVQEQIVDTSSPTVNMQRIRYPEEALAVSLHPIGDKPVTLLSWESGYHHPGLRYVNLGLPQGSIDMAHNLNAAFVQSDLEGLKPDLIVLGFGSVESLKDDLNIADYRKRFTALVHALKKMAPQASVLIMGPPDLSIMPEFAKGVSGSHACRALNTEETANYFKLVSNFDESLSRWYPPIKLELVRQTLRDVAMQEKAFFWDWSKIMGGPCGIHAWVHTTPKLASDDHKSLTAEGGKVSARALYSELMSGFEASRTVASH